LKKACPDIKNVEVLESFANFSDSVKQHLNIASTTPGDFPHITI
jgi:hypothetical protein